MRAKHLGIEFRTKREIACRDRNHRRNAGFHFQFELAGNSSYRGIDYRDVTVLEILKLVNMGMERWGFLLSVVSSPIVYFLKTTRAVCPNVNPIMLCTHVCDVTMRPAINLR